MARHSTGLEGVNTFFGAQLSQFLLRNLPLLVQIAFVANDDHRDVTNLSELFYPLADSKERIGVSQVKGHETGVESLYVRADDVCVRFLPRCIPNLHFRHRFPVNADVYGFCVSAVRFDLFDTQSGIWIDILQNETCFTHVKLAQDCNLNCRFFVLFLCTAGDDSVPHIRCRLI